MMHNSCAHVARMSCASHDEAQLEPLSLAMQLASDSDSRGRGSRIVSMVTVATLTWGRRDTMLMMTRRTIASRSTYSWESGHASYSFSVWYLLVL